ncbi:OPT family oligopeptide transporter [Cystobacter fuscus]|uniref:OPT family oligopeptide transporter n=1 Tax=Cystobacter fuscus TaxID=43 RepID=UPI002B2D37EC|nr:OPT family oligopeptide transporter [Cystobacter fuscus]
MREERSDPPPGAAASGRALTPRALALGGLLGAGLSLTNLYVGLKTGLAFPVTIIACVLGLGVYRALAWPWRTRSRPGLSLLETSAMQSTASSAGYSTGGTLISANVAWLMLSGHHPPGWALFCWTLLISALGVLFAVPLQHAFLHRERLPFPSGLAAASAARMLQQGDVSARQGVRALGGAALVAGLLTFLRDGLKRLPTSRPLPGALQGVPLASLSFSLDLSLLSPGVGALVGPRIAASLLLGAVACFGVLVPWLHVRGTLPQPDFNHALEWSMWPGTALVTSAAFTHLLSRRDVLRRAFSSLVRAGADPESGAGPGQVPRSWWLAGLALLSLGTVVLGDRVFGIPPHLGLFGVLISFPLAVAACRVTGETDVTPSGALGQLAQLAFCVVMPGNALANAIAASLSGSTAATSADLLTDVKAGSLLGATPRQTVLAQLWGCLVGSAVIVPAFLLLVPDTSVLSEEHFPAPGGTFVEGLARVLAAGLDALAPASRWGALAGGVSGILLALLEQHAPERLRPFVPSAIGVGIAFVLPPSTALSMFLGSLAAALLTRARPAFALVATVPLAAGLIAGESLVSLTLTLLAVLGLLPPS